MPRSGIVYADWLCAGYARPLVGTLRERTRFQNRVKRNKNPVCIQRASPTPGRQRRRVVEGNCIPARGAERRPETKARADRTEKRMRGAVRGTRVQHNPKSSSCLSAQRKSDGHARKRQGTPREIRPTPREGKAGREARPRGGGSQQRA